MPLAAEQPTVLPRPVVAVTDDTGDPDLDQVLETIWAAQVVCRTGHPPADGRTPPWRR